MEVPPRYLARGKRDTHQTRGRAAGFANMLILTVEFEGEKFFIPNAANILPLAGAIFGLSTFAHPFDR
jgi:hypothetical protein